MPTTDEARIDRLTRIVATGATRRGLLGLIAAAAVGGTADAEGRKRKPARHRKPKGTDHEPTGTAPSASRSAGPACAAAGGKACDARQARPGANLSGCDLSAQGLVGHNLSGANVSRANLAGAYLIGANLSGANLGSACLSGANLRDAVLRSANTGGADFTGAQLCGADLRGTGIAATQIAAAKVCCDTTLPNGKSAKPCPAGRTCCDSGCFDLKRSGANCGRCGNSCASGTICCNGRCVKPSAAAQCATGSCLVPRDDIQEAVDEAQDGDVILLCGGTWTLANTIVIGKRIDIFGSPDGTTVISGQHEVQVFGLDENAVVELLDLTVTDGFADQGAGIFNQGVLTLTNSAVQNGVARQGAGIYNEGKVGIYGVVIKDNGVAQGDDPLNPYYEGGGIYSAGGTVNLHVTSVVRNNSAYDGVKGDGYGAGIYSYSSNITLFQGSTVSDNTADADGGGLYANQSVISMHKGSKVTGNTAASGGGLHTYQLFNSGITIASKTIVTGNHPDNCSGTPAANCVG